LDLGVTLETLRSLKSLKSLKSHRETAKAKLGAVALSRDQVGARAPRAGRRLQGIVYKLRD
jgi:hypothetical protein